MHAAECHIDTLISFTQISSRKLSTTLWGYRFRVGKKTSSIIYVLIRSVSDNRKTLGNDRHFRNSAATTGKTPSDRRISGSVPVSIVNRSDLLSVVYRCSLSAPTELSGAI